MDSGAGGARRSLRQLNQQQRVEAMRIANWHQITDATWIKTNLLQADAPGSGSLKDFIETLTLAPTEPAA